MVIDIYSFFSSSINRLKSILDDLLIEDPITKKTNLTKKIRVK